MSEKYPSPPKTRWQRLSLKPIRFVLVRVLTAAFAVGIVTTIWTSHPGMTMNFSQDLPELFQQGLSKQSRPQAAFKLQAASMIAPLLSVEKAESLCQQHEMNMYPHRERRKVYDLFLVGTELDWVEIRMNELAPYVDYFVILEAETTFTNITKPKYFKKNWKHFQQFEHKIIYRVLNDDAIISVSNPWEREKYQRNALMSQIFPNLLGSKAPNQGDVILVSDVDEIPRPETVTMLRNCDFPARTGLQSRYFLYSFQLHRTDMDWYHPQATFWQGEKTILPESLRMEKTAYQIANAAWHCTSCFSTIAETVNKIEAFSHTLWNQPEFKDPDAIVRRVRGGIDIFDRDYPYERVEQSDMDFPAYLLQRKEKFWYLLDRDPPNANFRDYVPGEDTEGYDRSDEIIGSLAQEPDTP